MGKNKFLLFKIFTPVLVVVVIVFLLKVKPISNSSEQAINNIPPEEKTEECPINGKFFSNKQKDKWQKRRPLGIVVDNSVGARPQSGLSEADVVYEAVIEAGVTRLLAIYYCQSPEIVGPVRSARVYFLDLISEFGDFSLFAHVGGANTPGPANALGQIRQYGWDGHNDLDQYKVGFPSFWADYDRTGKDVATEHTIYTSAPKLWAYANSQRNLTEKNVDKITGQAKNWDLNFKTWNFKSNPSSNNMIEEKQVKINFMSNAAAKDYAVLWEYDPKDNSYFRLVGGQKSIDLTTKSDIKAKTVVLLQMKTSPAGDGYIEKGLGYHILYATIGRGPVKILLDGKVIEGAWSKVSRTARTVFKNLQNEEILLNRGQIWVELLPLGHSITFGSE